MLKERLLICDIDGVICDCSSRQKLYSDIEAYNRGDYNSFRISMNKFNSTCDGDVLISEGVQLLASLSDAYSVDRIVFLTARGESGREPTLAWLRSNIYSKISSDDLIMRVETPMISPGVWWEPGMVKFNSVTQKFEEVSKLMETYDVVLALDDKPDIISMYQTIPINALMVCWANVDCLSRVGDSRFVSK